jgi:hypothetical protein
MLQMDISNAIPNIVEAMLPRFSPKELALYIELDLRDTYYDDNEDDEKSIATLVKFIFHRPNNYTKVLVNYDFDNFSKSFTNSKMIKRYEQHSNHDSCWRSDGMVILNKHWKNINDYFGMHPNKLNRFYSFHKISYIKLLQFDKIQKEDRIIGYDIAFDKISSDIVKTLLDQLEKGK